MNTQQQLDQLTVKFNDLTAKIDKAPRGEIRSRLIKLRATISGEMVNLRQTLIAEQVNSDNPQEVPRLFRRPEDSKKKAPKIQREVSDEDPDEE